MGPVLLPTGSAAGCQGLRLCLGGAQLCVHVQVQVCVHASARRSCVRVHRCAGVCAGLCARACMAVQTRAAACACTHTSVCTRLRGGVSRGRSRGRAGTAAGPGALGMTQPRRAAPSRSGPSPCRCRCRYGACGRSPPCSRRAPPARGRPGPGRGPTEGRARGSRRCRALPGSVLRAARRRAGGKKRGGWHQAKALLWPQPAGSERGGPGLGVSPHHPRLRPHGRGEGSAGAAATLLSPGPQRRARRHGGCPGAGGRGGGARRLAGATEAGGVEETRSTGGCVRTRGGLGGGRGARGRAQGGPRLLTVV